MNIPSTNQTVTEFTFIEKLIAYRRRYDLTQLEFSVQFLNTKTYMTLWSVETSRKEVETLGTPVIAMINEEFEKIPLTLVEECFILRKRLGYNTKKMEELTGYSKTYFYWWTHKTGYPNQLEFRDWMVKSIEDEAPAPQMGKSKKSKPRKSKGMRGDTETPVWMRFLSKMKDSASTDKVTALMGAKLYNDGEVLWSTLDTFLDFCKEIKFKDITKPKAGKYLMANKWERHKHYVKGKEKLCYGFKLN